MRILWGIFSFIVTVILFFLVFSAVGRGDFVEAIFWSLWLLAGMTPSVVYVAVVNGRSAVSNGNGWRYRKLENNDHDE